MWEWLVSSLMRLRFSSSFLTAGFCSSIESEPFAL